MNANSAEMQSQASPHATRAGEWAYWSTLKWQKMRYETRLSEWKRHLAELDISFDSFRDQSILEVGCGPVGIVFFLDARNNVGLDPLADQYSQWNGYWGKRVNLIQAEGENMPLADASFDSVFCINVLDHTFHPSRVLSEINRVLKPRGRLVLHVDLDSPLRKLHKRLKLHAGVLHPQSLTYDSLLTQLHKYFEITKTHRDPKVFKPTWNQMKYEAYWDGLIYRFTRAKAFTNHIWVDGVKYNSNSRVSAKEAELPAD
jgi:ubiquinone/menaquinone biosynthesis C-methylase UbiE